MTNGLDALENRRNSRSAAIPPPRNPPRASQVSVAVSETTSPEPTPIAARSVLAKSPASAAAVVPDELIKATIHFTIVDDLFLEDVRVAGRRSTPRVDASRSAVTRLALAMLREQMEPAQIVAELVKRGPKTEGGAGRKRL